ARSSPRFRIPESDGTCLNSSEVGTYCQEEVRFFLAIVVFTTFVEWACPSSQTVKFNLNLTAQ
ncbi:MAG: hypothetical protein L0K64_09100, partial [Corynebacterium flavescens]|uniref:hypothetical protein n=1 Tax=Corynebacterium flavescens TaxID=28028 RepID=UPI0026473E66